MNRMSDLVNLETGKTFREENAELVHNIPIGALVECIYTGVRLFVVHYGRDCDQTPLYSLAADQNDTVLVCSGWNNIGWSGGYAECSLKVIRMPSD